MIQDIIDPNIFVPKAAKAAAEASDGASGAETVRQGIQQLREFSLSDLLTDLSQRLVNFAIDIAVAILVFYLGKFIIKRIYRFVGAIMVRRNVDRSLTTFVLSFIRIVLYFILIVTVIGILGIETSSFLAIFASAGVAIGMALSGTLQNFAGGVLILLLKPYRIGDYIEAQGYAGTVREIQIFHTIIATYDNKLIIIPNGGLSTASVNNWSREAYRRVSWSVAISYGDSVDDARRAILDMFATDPRIVKNPEADCDRDDPTCPDDDTTDATAAPRRRSIISRILHPRRGHVAEAVQRIKESTDSSIKSLRTYAAKPPAVIVNELADSSVNLSVRAWVRTDDYWNVFYDYNERIYAELPAHGIHFPFPQLDVHFNPGK